GVTARSTAATADATAPPRSAASGCRRTAVHTAARNVSGVTSPASDAVTQPGSRPGRRSAIWAASTDLPIPPTPCTTRAAAPETGAARIGWPWRGGRTRPAGQHLRRGHRARPGPPGGPAAAKTTRELSWGGWAGWAGYR